MGLCLWCFVPLGLGEGDLSWMGELERRVWGQGLTIKVPRGIISPRVILVINYSRRRARPIRSTGINLRAIVLATFIPRLQLQEARRERLPALTLPAGSRSYRCSYVSLAEEVGGIAAGGDFVRERVVGRLRAVGCCCC